MIEHRITITSKGQITIPAEFRRSLGLKTSDQLTAKISDGNIVLTPDELCLEDVFGSLRPPPGVRFDDIEKHISEAVEDESDRLAEEYRRQMST